MLPRALCKVRKELSYKLCEVGLCVAPLPGKHMKNNKNYLNSGKQDHNAKSAQLQQMSFTYDLQGCPWWPCLNCHHKRLAQSFRWTNNPTQSECKALFQKDKYVWGWIIWEKREAEHHSCFSHAAWITIGHIFTEHQGTKYETAWEATCSYLALLPNKEGQIQQKLL